MKVAITGVSGFIAGALARRLRADGDDVVGIDLVPGADTVVGDVTQPQTWSAAVTGCDVLVHAAARVGMPSRTDDFWPVNVLGTRGAMEACRRAGVPRFILLSSVTVFGNDFPDQVAEDYPTRPTGVPYADSKISAEHVALWAHVRGIVSATIVRPGDVYGPGSRPWTVLPVQMIAARRTAVPNRGRGIHSPVFVDDVVDGLCRALRRPAAEGQIITLSGGVGVPTGQFLDYYARMLGRSAVPRVPTPVAVAAARALGRLSRGPIELSPDAVHYLADRRGTYSVARAAELLDWRPITGLPEGMAVTERWLGAQGYLAAARP